MPILWLAALMLAGRRRDYAWWLLASALGVSFVADSLRHYVDKDIVGNMFPLSQSALIGIVLLNTRTALNLILALVAMGSLSLLWRGPDGVDVVLRATAWLMIAGLAYRHRYLSPPLRASLIITFGGGWLGWIVYTAVRAYYMEPDGWHGPFWATWYPWLTYQFIRLTGTAVFCYAAWRAVDCRSSALVQPSCATNHG